MTRTKLSLLAGATLLALTIALPASAAPTGSYRQSCRDIQQHNDRTLSAECQTRDGDWVHTELRYSNCDGDIANSNGRLVCNDDDDDDDRADRAYDSDRRYGDNDRRYNDSDRGYVQPTGYVLSRARLVQRMHRQGYYAVRDLRPIYGQRNWRALATWHGRRVVVRLNASTGRVISARYI